MEQYVGLNISLKETSLCVVDQTGTTLWQGKCASTLESGGSAGSSFLLLNLLALFPY
jgi:hypothetical protein